MHPHYRRHICAVLGYALVAVVFTWPLAAHFGTHLTGSPAGDAGVYVWNQWVFQHELLEHLDEVGRPLLETGRPVHAAVQFGQPAREIINFARKGQFDLIIMATHGRSSVIAEVIRSGVAMVLVLPPALVSQRDKQNGSSL